MLSAMALPVEGIAFVPATDDEILESLPESNRRNASGLRLMRERLAQKPESPEAAIRLAASFLELGQSEGDPRYLGNAQAALQAWWAQDNPPEEILLLRAALKQNRHEFDAALADLTQLLHGHPGNERAWVLQAVIQIAQADYPAAMRSCEALTQLRHTFLAFTCLGSMASLRGQAKGAYTLLQYAEARAAHSSLPEQVRLQTLLAKTAERLNEIPLAERHYRQALILRANDPGALSAYADFLLDQGRSQEVIGLLGDSTRIDGLLLRLCLAESRVGAGELERHRTELGARYAASRARGDTVHRGDEARWRLHLRKEPETALSLAADNWQVQREPRDARILLETALAAKRPLVAGPAMKWVEDTHIEDIRLRDLVSRLKALN